MNGVEQQQRRTAVNELGNRITKLAEVFDEEIKEVEAHTSSHIDDVVKVVAEHAFKRDKEMSGLLDYLHRTENDQRHYVDNADRLLAARQTHFEGLRFWGRFRWLFTGRVL